MQKKDFFTVLGRKATKEILEILDDQGTASYKDFHQVASLFTVNSILRSLTDLELIQLHRIEHEKKEWYESTEKGKKVLQYLRELEELIKE
jgi:predicted transcriptional regulator